MIRKVSSSMMLTLILVIVLSSQSSWSSPLMETFYRNDYKDNLNSISTHTEFDPAEQDPESYVVQKESVTFYLYTKQNRDEPIQLDINNPKIDNNNATVIFFIHGWTESRDSLWYKLLKNQLFAKTDNTFDIIEVDYNHTSRKLYPIAAYNAGSVGTYIGDFMVELMKNSAIPLERFMTVGISLGGQISGFVGKQIFSRTAQKLPRIVALDPAGPLFVGRKPDYRLNKDDAEVVEVLHTNGGGFGVYYPCGTLELYANGGSVQPGCESGSSGLLGNVTMELCSHIRSALYYIEAASNPHAFEAVKCDDYSKFHFGKCENGEKVYLGDMKTRKTGKFYFNTNEESPFSQS